jgi:hypothetical protein
MPSMPKLRAPRFLEVVLVLSLALNLFVAGGFAYSQYTATHPTPTAAGGPERRLENFALKLGIDPEGSMPFKEWHRDLKAAQSMLMHQNRPLIEQAWDELGKPAPDAQHIQQLLDQMAVNRHAFQASATAATIKFLGTLDGAQRKAFLRMAADRQNPLAAPVRNSLGN